MEEVIVGASAGVTDVNVRVNGESGLPPGVWGVFCCVVEVFEVDDAAIINKDTPAIRKMKERALAKDTRILQIKSLNNVAFWNPPNNDN
jgi:hypothetical protein